MDFLTKDGSHNMTRTYSLRALESLEHAGQFIAEHTYRQTLLFYHSQMMNSNLDTTMGRTTWTLR